MIRMLHSLYKMNRDRERERERERGEREREGHGETEPLRNPVLTALTENRENIARIPIR